MVSPASKFSAPDTSIAFDSTPDVSLKTARRNVAFDHAQQGCPACPVDNYYVVNARLWSLSGEPGRGACGYYATTSQKVIIRIRGKVLKPDLFAQSLAVKAYAKDPIETSPLSFRYDHPNVSLSKSSGIMDLKYQPAINSDYNSLGICPSTSNKAAYTHDRKDRR